jgi:hypothetical protein
MRARPCSDEFPPPATYVFAGFMQLRTGLILSFSLLKSTININPTGPKHNHLGSRAIVTAPGHLSGLSTIGTPIALGRPITPEDARPGAPYVAVLSDERWRRYCGGIFRFFPQGRLFRS